MLVNKSIYSFRHDTFEQELCRIESKYIFNQIDKNKILVSDIKFEPSNSPFIKRRLDIISCAKEYNDLLNQIKNKNIFNEGFKIEYLVFDGDKTEYPERLVKLKDIGYLIEGDPDYYHPTITYALCYFQAYWCFAILIKNKDEWHKHKKKPCSYSNSININTAKAMVNIAAKANKEKTLLDACCGVGTIMLEACFAGYKIEGCDISWKVCRNARMNLSYFNYTSTIYRSDIKDIQKKYDAAIIDLPYNILSSASEHDFLHIIESTAKISDRCVIVSITDISNLIEKVGFEILDYCEVGKSGKRKFARKIWVCEKKI